jgi:hypothetical protein
MTFSTLSAIAIQLSHLTGIRVLWCTHWARIGRIGSKLAKSMSKPVAVIGLLLAAAAVAAAIFWEFPYWYTPFTIGSFLFFDQMSKRFAGRSVLHFLARGHWRVGVLIYLAAVGTAVIVDVVYGRMLAGAWVYPPWHGIANIVVPVLFHYPFGFLSLYATFQTVRGLLGVAGQTSRGEPVRRDSVGQTAMSILRFDAPGKWYGRIAVIALAICLVVPLLNYWLNANHGEGELLFVVMLVGTAAFDGTREALTGDSILRELLMHGPRYAAAVVVTLAWAILVDEGPNVFAHEWVYLINPFGLPLWLILILGWPFLLVVSAAVYETAVALTGRNIHANNFVRQAS